MPADPLAVVTLAAKNYVSFARVLGESFRRFHPEVAFSLVLVDEVEDYLDPEEEPFELFELRRLAPSNHRELVFRYGQLPASVAAKATAIAAMLDRGHGTVVFIDADVLVLAPLTELFAVARDSSITLTPHLLEPPDVPDRIERELAMLLSGVFNGGMVAVSDTSHARDFLAWWQSRLRDHCRHAVEEGMHFDQRWLDLVPEYFEGVSIVRDPGVNVAHWNLHERRPQFSGAWVTGEGLPCRAFHFSGYDPSSPGSLTRYSRDSRLDEHPQVVPLFDEYRRALVRAGWNDTRLWPYSYDSFDNGVPIPPLLRELYAGAGDADRFGDPFAFDGGFLRWLAEPTAQDGSLPRLWELVRMRRPDLRAAFPDPGGRDRDTFRRWAREHGAAEYALPAAIAEQVTACGA